MSDIHVEYLYMIGNNATEDNKIQLGNELLENMTYCFDNLFLLQHSDIRIYNAAFNYLSTPSFPK